MNLCMPTIVEYCAPFFLLQIAHHFNFVFESHNENSNKFHLFVLLVSVVGTVIWKFPSVMII